MSKWLKKASKYEELPSIVMEATGLYHEGIAIYLHDLGYQVSILQSGRVKKYAQSSDQRSKTDALDSKILSMFGCERSLMYCSPASSVMQTLKALSRERSALIKDKCIEKNRQGAIDSSIYSNKKEIRRFNQRLKLLNAQITEVELEMREVTAA
ncbi:MAG: transposase [Patiriisocius sp.]